MITIDKETKTVTISEKINVAKLLNILAEATDCNFDDWDISVGIKEVNTGINIEDIIEDIIADKIASINGL